MKKFLSVFLACTSLSCLLFTSCTKEASVKSSTVNSNASANATMADKISAAIDPKGYLGVYTVRDSKTIYMGQANDDGSNVLIHLDYIDVKKSVLPTADKKHLTMPYGPSNYVDSGWAYIIDYDFKENHIVLSPNQAMLDDIVPGSFEVKFVRYFKELKQASFVTRFTALSDKGRETQITEFLYKGEL